MHTEPPRRHRHRHERPRGAAAASPGWASPRPRAFTFVEVIISLAILSLAMVMVYSLSGSGSRLFIKGTDKSKLLQDGALALEKLAREIEQCQAVVALPSSYAAKTDPPNQGTGLKIRLFVDHGSPDFDKAPYRTDRLVEYTCTESARQGRFDLLRTESSLGGSGSFPVKVLEGLLTRPAVFTTDSSAGRTLKISIELAEPETSKQGFRGTVRLSKAVYLHSCD